MSTVHFKNIRDIGAGVTLTFRCIAQRRCKRDRSSQIENNVGTPTRCFNPTLKGAVSCIRCWKFLCKFCLLICLFLTTKGPHLLISRQWVLLHYYFWIWFDIFEVFVRCLGIILHRLLDRELLFIALLGYVVIEGILIHNIV